jgi:hypothetical protein
MKHTLKLLLITSGTTMLSTSFLVNDSIGVAKLETPQNDVDHTTIGLDTVITSAYRNVGTFLNLPNNMSLIKRLNDNSSS